MKKPAYIITSSSISIVWDGKPYIINSDNLNFNSLKKVLLKGEYDKIPEHIDIQKRIADASFGNIKIVNGEVFYRNLKLNGAVVQNLLQSLREGAVDVQPTINFIERLMANPSNNSVDQLYTFLNYKSLPITPEGNVIGYKGVKSDFYSKNGNKNTVVLKGKVDDDGHIFNGIGEEIIVARNSVDDNKNNHCSHGLHIGSYDYARDWAGSDGRLMMVEFDPADAVSVPTDCSFQKLRVCRYKVIGEVPQEKRSNDDAPLRKSVYDTSKEVKIDEDDDGYDDAADSDLSIATLAIKNYVENKCAAGEPPTLKQIQSRMKGWEYSCEEIANVCTHYIGFTVNSDEDIPMSQWIVSV